MSLGVSEGRFDFYARADAVFHGLDPPAAAQLTLTDFLNAADSASLIDLLVSGSLSIELPASSDNPAEPTLYIDISSNDVFDPTSLDTVTAVNVEIPTDGRGNNVGIITINGDILVDRISVGHDQGQIALTAPGNIREVDNFDGAVGLEGALGILLAGGEIGSQSQPELNLETDFGRLIDREGGDFDLGFVDGDVYLFFILEGDVSLTATGPSL